MGKMILIVDDEKAVLQSLSQGLIRCNETFTVLTAEDGFQAVAQLKEHTVSIVVTDLKMPGMDGFSLLAHILDRYPEIPVIVMTGFSTEAMERSAQKGGAVGYISKPFMIQDMAEKIAAILSREADGGTLHGISSGMFLQLVEMEEKTCTIRLISKSTGRQGVLFFREGDLLDARVGGLRGEEAALEIFSWEEVSLSIQNSCQQREKRIHRDLQAILVEAVTLKDERRSKAMAERGTGGKTEVGKSEALSPERVRRLLAGRFSDGAGVEDIYEDDAWRVLVQEMEKLAVWLKAGDFKAAYMDRGDFHSFFILPGEKVTVVCVNPKCPRDRLVEVLSGLS